MWIQKNIYIIMWGGDLDERTCIECRIGIISYNINWYDVYGTTYHMRDSVTCPFLKAIARL